MATKNDIVFEKNQFTRDILQSGNRDLFIGLFNVLVGKSKGEMAPGNTSNDYLDTLINAFSKDEKDTASLNLAKLLYRFYNDPTYITTTGFIQYWDFMSGFLNRMDATNTHLVLNKLSVFDEKTQLEILKHIRINQNLLSGEDMKSVYIMIYQNPESTIFDKFIVTGDLRDRCINRPDYRDIDLLYETIAIIKNAIKEELAKDFPNQRTIEQLSQWARTLLYEFKEKRTKFDYGSPQEYKDKMLEVQKFINITMEEFDLSKLLKFGLEHFTRTNQSLEERVVIAERRAQEAESKAQSAEQRANALTTTNEQLQTTINSKEAEIKRKETELSEEKTKAERSSQQAQALQTELDAKSNFLKRLKMKLATLKFGMFGNGKEFQTWLASELDNQLSN